MKSPQLTTQHDRQVANSGLVKIFFVAIIFALFARIAFAQSPPVVVFTPMESIGYGENGFRVDRWCVDTNGALYRERAQRVTTNYLTTTRTVLRSPRAGGAQTITVPLITYATNFQRLLFSRTNDGVAGFGYNGLYGFTDLIAPNPITNLLLTVFPPHDTNFIESSPEVQGGWSAFTNFTGSSLIFRVNADQQFYRTIGEPAQTLKLEIP